MKFVYNEEKNLAMRNILMMQPSLEEAEAELKKDETDPLAWYKMGVALANSGKVEEAIEAHSIGIAYAPFYAPNYFGRGRRHNASKNGEWRQAIADFTLCIQIDPSNWTYWYYRATTWNTVKSMMQSYRNEQSVEERIDSSTNWSKAYHRLSERYEGSVDERPEEHHRDTD